MEDKYLTEHEIIHRSKKDSQYGLTEVIIGQVIFELGMARKNFPAFNSEHEGFAILLEEVDELWEAVRMKQSNPDRPVQVKKEAIQVAAMALRFLSDCVYKDSFSSKIGIRTQETT